MPERRIGSEGVEASAKLRKSSIDCLNAASFEAARSEQLRLPAEEPLKRGSTELTIPSLSRERDASSCKARAIPCQDYFFQLTDHTICTVGASQLTPILHSDSRLC